jgi:mycoredoxin
MLNVYAASWCPHCRKTIEFFEENQIEYNYIDMETQPESVVKKVVEVNGGDDWVVPTLEYNGRWRKGKVFNAENLRKDLINLGALKA